MTADGTSSCTAQTTGTPEEEWARWPGLDRVPSLDLGGVREAVVVAPHPDDETLGFGGGLAVLAARGVRLRIVAVTDGESSHPGSSVFTRNELVARRADERARALTALGAGAAEVERLRLPDGGVGEREPELARRLAELYRGADLCVAPWEGDPHPDHEAVGRAALDAARALGTRLLSYPVWAWHWTRPGDAALPWDRAGRLRLPRDARRRKAAAIGAFTTQIFPIGPGAADRAILGPSVLAHFARDHEVVFT
ncbi:PIG-L deacetylase family protein [Nocardiopsis sp. NPDC058631]|uniref:PIG-L deacetylase family protein n=1 Tax=Nocardiopsis sp. NPDC058631 TaxID=3346566 RepID=UPI00364F8578